MIDKDRRVAVLRLRALMDEGVPRKQALLDVLTVLKKNKMPASPASLYLWCKKFGVSTK